MSVFETLPREKRELIEEHLRLVIAANERLNLTRIDTFEEGMTLHVEDSLAALEELSAAPKGLYGDLGSGAGYPGVPLAVASERPTTLIDTRKKKMGAVAEIIEELGLEKQISVYAGRAELLARQNPGVYTALTARALAELAVLLELASPLLARGGVLICYKAKVDEAEYARAERVQPLVGMTLKSDREFMLNGEYRRRILVFEKIANSTIKLPRKEGEAQKNPLP